MRYLTAKFIHPARSEFRAYLDIFKKSPTFCSYLENIKGLEQSGEQQKGTTVYNHTVLLLESYERARSGDYAWYKEKTDLSEDLFIRIHNFAFEVSQNPQLEKLFYLVLYAHDFGKVHRKTIGHQEAGAPVFKKIFEEIKTEFINHPEWAELGGELVKMHTVPAEIFLGEFSAKNLLNKCQEITNNNFIKLLVLLNLFDVNSIKNSNGLFNENIEFILNLTDKFVLENLADNSFEERLKLLSVIRFPKKAYDQEESLIKTQSKQRYEDLLNLIQVLPSEQQFRIKTLLAEINFSYTASLLPNMSLEAVLKFLIINANICIDNSGKVVYPRVLNKNDRLGRELNDYLMMDLHDSRIISLLISIIDNKVIWDPNVFYGYKPFA